MTRFASRIVLTALVMIASPTATGGDVDSSIYSAWQAMRQLDCARCHGRDYDGSVGPSLLDATRTRTRDEFVRLVLDGDPARGMPPYRSVALATENVQGMYVYLAGRANGTIASGVLRRESAKQ